MAGDDLQGGSANGKGKGKGRDTDPSTSQPPPGSQRNDNARDRSTPSLANSMAASLRSTFASNQLGSLLASASNGKGEFAAFRQGGAAPSATGLSRDDLRSSMIADLQGAAPSSVSSPQTVAGFRSSATRVADPSRSAESAVDSFDSFSQPFSIHDRPHPQGAVPGLLQAERDIDRFSPGRIGAYSSSRDLDHALHAQVRAMEGLHLGGPTMDQAWRDAETSVRNLTDEQKRLALDLEWNSRWASQPPLDAVQPAATHLSDRDAALSTANDGATGIDTNFMGLLAAEEAKEQSQGPSAPEFARPSWDTTTNDTIASLPVQWRPPSPSLPAHLCVTREQLEMHRSIAAAQTDAEHALRQGEAIAPRDDDEEAREGVYAATAQEALRSVWEGRGGVRESLRRDDVQSEGREGQGEWSVQRGREAVTRIREWLPLSSYVDDVYGLPATLADTMRKAVAETTTQQDAAVTEAAREKAIRRLEALWGHLSASRPSAVRPSDAAVGPSQPAPPPIQPRQSGNAQWMEDWLNGQHR